MSPNHCSCFRTQLCFSARGDYVCQQSDHSFKCEVRGVNKSSLLLALIQIALNGVAFVFFFILVMVVDPVFSKMQSVNIENSGGMLDTRQEYTLDVIPVHWVMCKNLHKCNNHIVSSCRFGVLGSSHTDGKQQFFKLHFCYLYQWFISKGNRAWATAAIAQFRFVSMILYLYGCQYFWWFWNIILLFTKGSLYEQT